MSELITPIVCQHCEQDWKHGACGDCSMTRKQLDACIDLQKQLQQARQEAARSFLELAEEHEGGKCELYDLVDKRFGLEG